MEQGGEARTLVVPVSAWREGVGGIRDTGRHLEAVSASGRVLERIPSFEGWVTELDDYSICARFQNTLWCIGRPFSARLRATVDFKQNGYECTGELEVVGVTDLVFGWEVLVSNEATLLGLENVPGYVFDVAFPTGLEGLHDPRDIVLRRRIVEQLEDFVCAGRGQFKVSKNQTREFDVNNYFEGRPDPLNRPAIATLFPDVLTARREGRTTY